MNEETLVAIRQHAVECYPKESCGVVIIRKGREAYIGCRNRAETPLEHFVLSAEDYADAEDQGEVAYIVHSHPDAHSRPSQADLTACESSGYPWAIVEVIKDGESLTAGEINTFSPSGYDPGYVGVEFSHGINDCYSLVRRWYCRELGLTLPDFERRDQWWDDGHSDLYSQHFAECGFEQVSGALQTGDAILMQIRSKNGVPNHAAIYLGDGVMLHHLYGRLSSRDVYGGMWRDYTRLILRHKDATVLASAAGKQREPS